MKDHQGFDSLRPELFVNPVATVGVFDGVHLGHRAVIDATRDLARELGGESVVVTFGTHPRQTLTGRPPRMLTSLSHRLVLLERAGVDHAVVLPFDRTVMEISAGEFADRVFRDGLRAAGIVLGFDSRFGRGREGTAEFLARWADGTGIVVRSAPPVLMEGRPISSSVIRDLIAGGDHDSAQAMLGRPVAVFGRAVPGSHRGRGLGFATANLDIEGELTPPLGVYAAWARLKGSWRAALVNIGTRPTFEGDDAPVMIEVHVPGLSGDLYGSEIEVQFIRRLREERRFPDAAALVEQIDRDRAELDRIVASIQASPQQSLNRMTDFGDR